MKKTYNVEAARTQLKNYLLYIAPETNQSELEELVQEFTPQYFTKKEIILKAGDFSDTVYFITEGLVRIYYVKEEKEITNWFLPENRAFTAAYSVLSGQPNYSNYETLEDTYTLTISYSRLEFYYTKYHTLEHLGRRLIEAYYGAFMRKTFDVLFLSAEERYNLFIKEHESILNRVPLRYVASYLGLTQETLSRLRSKF
ncbi:MAG: hypothetical protein RJA25_2640 [Bacteroidota bacterium]|jgi:CRP-like cAMP-binding protein